MKKKLLVLIACLGLVKIALAQKDSLANDEHGKLIYYRVVNEGKDDENVLLVRGLDFFDMPANSSAFKIINKDGNSHTFEVVGHFLVSNVTSLAKHDDGRITFKVHVEIKGQKYRYWLTNFVFTPYYKDRYNNFVPQPGVEMPMEDIVKKVNNAKDANHYLDECGAMAIKLSNRLKLYMANGPVKTTTTTTKKVVTVDKW